MLFTPTDACAQRAHAHAHVFLWRIDLVHILEGWGVLLFGVWSVILARGVLIAFHATWQLVPANTHTRARAHTQVFTGDDGMDDIDLFFGITGGGVAHEELPDLNFN